MDPLAIDTNKVTRALVAFLREEFAKAGFKRAILGLSGGIDSSVSAALCALAFSPENVHGVLMPYRTSSEASVADAEELVRHLGIHSFLEEITPQIDLYFREKPDADRLRRGNKMARERMAILYDHSKRLGALVVGTGNRTEGLLGYTTVYGDNACAVNPIGDLLKTEVRQLARALGIPARIIEKPPSADLWEGQTDEGELGVTYATVDLVLHDLFDRGLTREEAIAAGRDAALVDRAMSIERANRWKSRLPPVARLDAAARGR